MRVSAEPKPAVNKWIVHDMDDDTIVCLVYYFVIASNVLVMALSVTITEQTAQGLTELVHLHACVNRLLVRPGMVARFRQANYGKHGQNPDSSTDAFWKDRIISNNLHRL